jgi:hypothetical protein
MVEESETPEVASQGQAGQDVLAQRRARRAEVGEHAVLRRAEAAEAAVRNLETHLASLEQRLAEVGQERERATSRLAERERDVGQIKQREYTEQQLRVEAQERAERIQRELRDEIRALNTRLEQAERDIRELNGELTRLRERDERLQPIVHELMDVAASLRTGFERELSGLREELQQEVIWERQTYVRELTSMAARMEDLRFELTRTAADLREQLRAADALVADAQEGDPSETEREAAHRREMADALVAAVDRLRARVAEVRDAEPSAPEQAYVTASPAPVAEPATVSESLLAPEQTLMPPQASAPEPAPAPVAGESSPLAPPAPAPAFAPEPVALRPVPMTVPSERMSWLAPAIRRVAAQRDAKLAAELVIELLPAQRQVIDGSVTYELKIDELGAFHVAADPSHVTIARDGASGQVEFSIEGSAASLSELAAGSAKRKHPGVRLRKGRRRARRLLRARREPIALADLTGAGVDVWPGLLLLAMAEAIDPSWTAGHRFEIAFEIAGTPGVVIYVRVCDGEPILVSRATAGEPAATVTVGEHALIRLLAGMPAIAGEDASAQGDLGAVHSFLAWAARAQGLVPAQG